MRCTEGVGFFRSALEVEVIWSTMMLAGNERSTVVVAREWATGGISYLNPLGDHYILNNDILIQY